MDLITQDAVAERIEVARRQRINLDFAALSEMARVMEEQDGLLNVPQAATCLGVTRPRVRQMILDGVLQRWTFMGQHYVSYREVAARRLSDIKGGRPPRSISTRVKLGVQAAFQSDPAQVALGGFRGKRK